ncbi:MAG: riboflavin kinase, partial [Clostridia bacterium]|nr:riboflavin kinase [Clostridia bacterium]
MAALTSKSVLALGLFDSVHAGHRYLLNKARQYAEALEAELRVLTFDDRFFANLGRRDKEVYLLDERLPLFRQLGYGEVTVLEPTKEFLAQSPEAFLSFVMTLNPVAIVAGSDYTFGYLGQGKMGDLKAYMAQKGIYVYEIDLQKYLKEKISTTKIKSLLEKGDIESANILLGDSYFVSGTVQKGRGVGTSIGIPTANITVPALKQLPLEGVYKTLTETDGA